MPFLHHLPQTATAAFHIRIRALEANPRKLSPTGVSGIGTSESFPLPHQILTIEATFLFGATASVGANDCLFPAVDNL